MQRGQFIRLFLGADNTAVPAAVIAAAKTMSLHISCQVEDTTTKDTTDTWIRNSITGISYDISVNALVDSGESITSSVAGKKLSDLITTYEAGSPVKWQIANVSGTNNRTKGAVICSGSCVISQLTINAQNRQNATYDASLQGFGDIVVGAGT